MKWKREKKKLEQMNNEIKKKTKNLLQLLNTTATFSFPKKPINIKKMYPSIFSNLHLFPD